MNKTCFNKSIARSAAGILALTSIFLFQSVPEQVFAGEAHQAVALTLGHYRFSPEKLVVRSGQPVLLTLTNEDKVTPHNFSLQNQTAGLDIDVDVTAGASSVVEFTPGKPGTYTFYCNKKLPFMKSHRARGMQGTLLVK